MDLERGLLCDPIGTGDLLMLNREAALLEHLADVVRRCQICRRPDRPAPDMNRQVFYVFQRAIGCCFQISLPGCRQGWKSLLRDLLSGNCLGQKDPDVKKIVSLFEKGIDSA